MWKKVRLPGGRRSNSGGGQAASPRHTSDGGVSTSSESSFSDPSQRRASVSLHRASVNNTPASSPGVISPSSFDGLRLGHSREYAPTLPFSSEEYDTGGAASGSSSGSDGSSASAVSLKDKQARRRAQLETMARQLAEDAARSQAEAEKNVQRAADARNEEAQRRRAAGAEAARETRDRQQKESDLRRNSRDIEALREAEFAEKMRALSAGVTRDGDGGSLSGEEVAALMEAHAAQLASAQQAQQLLANSVEKTRAQLRGTQAELGRSEQERGLATEEVHRLQGVLREKQAELEKARARIQQLELDVVELRYRLGEEGAHGSDELLQQMAALRAQLVSSQTEKLTMQVRIDDLLDELAALQELLRSRSAVDAVASTATATDPPAAQAGPSDGVPPSGGSGASGAASDEEPAEHGGPASASNPSASAALHRENRLLNKQMERLRNEKRALQDRLDKAEQANREHVRERMEAEVSSRMGQSDVESLREKLRESEEATNELSNENNRLQIQVEDMLRAQEQSDARHRTQLEKQTQLESELDDLKHKRKLDHEKLQVVEGIKEKCQDDLMRAREQLTVAQDTIRDLKADAERAIESKNEMRKERDNLDVELEHRQESHRELDAEMNRWKKQAGVLSDQLRTVEEQCSQLGRERDLLDAERKRMKDELEELEDMLNALQGREEDLDLDAKRSRQSIRTATNEREDALQHANHLQARLARAESELDNMRQKIEALENSNREFSANAADLTGTNASLQVQMLDAEQRAQESAEKVLELSKRLRELEHELEHHKTLPNEERLSLEGVIRQLRIELVEEKRVRADEEAKLAAEKASLAEAVLRQQELQQDLSSTQATIADVESQLHESAIKVARMQRVTEQAINDMEKANLQAKEAIARTELLVATVASKDVKLKQAHVELERAQSLLQEAEERIIELENELTALKQQLHAQIKKTEHLEQDKCQLLEEQVQVAQELAGFKMKSEEHVELMREKDSRLSLQQNELTELQDRLAVLDVERGERERREEKLLAQCQQEATNTQRVQQELNQQQSTNIALQGDLEVMTGKFNGEVEEVVRLEKLLATLKDKVAILDGELVSLRPRVVVLSGDCDRLQDELGTQKAAVAEHRAKQALLDDQLRAVELARADLTAELAKQREAEHRQQKELQELQSELAQQNQQTQALEEELRNEAQEVERSLAQAQEKLGKLAKQNQELQQQEAAARDQLENLRVRVPQLEREKELALDDLKTTKEKLAAQQDRVQDLEKEIRSLSDELQNKGELVKRLGDRVQDMQGKLSEARMELEKAHIGEEEKENDHNLVLDALKKARKDADEEKISLGIALDEAKKEVANCENRLKHVKDQLQNTRAELDNESRMRAALEYLKERLEQEVESMKKQLYRVVDQQVDGLKAKLAPGAENSPYQEVMVPRSK
mmetsp:Transcript_17786/g.53367  ORF Transcript_17786/g.53367 Transcript_17786/m.53367 type:complete len:1422 (-) Transcript_17786:784-5049(-)